MLNFLRKQMKWVMAIIVVAFLLSTFFMYEGRSTRRSPSVNADGTMSDYEVAQINGRSFMRSELETRTRSYLSTLSTRNLASLDMAAIYQTVLNQAVLESQLVKEIDEQGIKVSDADAEQAMKVYADTYYPTRETFYQALANSGIKVEDYKRNLARQIAVDQLMTNAIGEIEISEDKALEFYDSMKNLFYTQPEGFMVHMADFKTSNDAEAFRAKLVAGESWDVIASEDKGDEFVNITKAPVFLPSSALRMGTLSVLASLDIAEPSEVFTVSSSDFAVGLKASHVDQSTRPYGEVSGDIKTLLTQEEQRKRLADYEESLRNKAQVVINDTELFTSKKVSADEEAAPEILIEEVKDEASKPEEKSEKTEEPATVEPVETKEEAKTDEAKTEETPAPAEAEKVEEAKAETKTEEVKEESPAAEVEPEVKAEEIKDEAPVEEPKEEIKEDSKPEAEAEVKQEQEAPAAEEAKEEAKPEEPETKEAEQTEEAKVEEAKTEVKEEINDAAKEIKNEVETSVEAVTESLDAALEIPTETK